MTIDTAAPWLILGVGAGVALFAASRRKSAGASHLLVSGLALAALGGYLRLKTAASPFTYAALALFVVLIGVQLSRVPRSRVVRDPAFLVTLAIVATVAVLEFAPGLSGGAETALLWTLSALLVLFVVRLVWVAVREVTEITGRK